MSRFLLIFLALSNSISLFSQNWKDSIQQFQSDTAALDYLHQEFNKVIYSNPEVSSDIVILYDTIAQSTSNPKYQGQAKILNGNIFFTKGEHDKALPYFIDAAKILEPLNEPKLLGRAYNNLGSCYQIRNDTKTSTSYFIKALRIYENTQDTLWIANVNSNLGLQYLNDGHLEEAEKHLNAAISNYDQIGNTIFKGISLLNRGNLRIEQQQYSAAIIDYEKCQELIPESVSPLAKAASEGGIGSALNRLGRFQQALPHLQTSLEKAITINHREQIKESNRELAAVYKSLDNHRLSLEHYEAYSQIKDSIFTLEQDAKLVDALTKYESEKKENAITLLNSQNEIQLTKLTARKNQVLILCCGGVVLLGLIALLYWMYSKIKVQNKVIATSLEEKETLLREIHHRVKNNLQVISALLTLQSKHVKDDIAFEALQEGQGRVQSMALIHQNLYQQDNLKGVETKEYFEKLIENLVETYQTNEQNIEIHSDIESMILDVDTMIPLGLVVNELTSNALKHAFHSRDNGNITIILREIDTQLHLSVKDDGMGAKLFQLENKSFGFSLIKSFARRLNAKLAIENNNGLLVELLVHNYQKAA